MTRSVGSDAIRVLLVGTGDDFGTELEREGFEVARIPDLASLGPGSDQDAVIVAIDDPGPLQALETLRLKTPTAAVLVLMRGFASVSLYLRELREAGIPFVASGGKTFYARPEIVQAIGVLRAVADEADPIARLAYLRSPAGGVPDAEILTGSPRLVAAEHRLGALRAEIASIPARTSEVVTAASPSAGGGGQRWKRRGAYSANE